MSRSPHAKRARTGTRIAALAAPLLAWMTPAAASPDAPAPPSEVASPDAPASPSDVASPDAPADAAASPDPSVEADEELEVLPSDGASPDASAAPEAAASPDAVAPPAASSESSPAAGAVAPDALAPSPRTAASPVALAAARNTGSSGSPWIGAMADLGLPDGATVSLVVRPIRSLRAHAGFSHNLISLGERVGLTWAPLPWWASPTVSLEYGHYADGNANPLVRAATGDTTFSSAVLDRVGYNYANAHLGVELGRQWFTFYLHAGASRISTTVHNLSAETMSESAGTTSVRFSKDPSVQLWTVSARLGFIVYLAK